MLFSICGGVSINLSDIFDSFFIFAKWKQNLLNFSLVEVNVWVASNIMNNVASILKRIMGLALGWRNMCSDLWLVGATHRYIILSGVSRRTLKQNQNETFLIDFDQLQTLTLQLIKNILHSKMGIFISKKNVLAHFSKLYALILSIIILLKVYFSAQYIYVQLIIILGISILYQYLLVQMNKPPKTLQEKTIAFFRTVQAGDISLFDIMPQAVAVFGFTKVGKTSSCHILANSPLKAQLLNGQMIYKPASQKYNTATIGITNESETQIPNIFETKFRDSTNTFRTITILDQPGYGDSYGFHRIFSNGYFHYRTFSKTPKLKFILAFKKADLQGTAQKFKNTLQYFINTFIDYKSIKDKIQAATSFLITQADPKTKIENIKNTLDTLKKTSANMMTVEQNSFFQEIVSHMVSNNKVFIIQRPQQPGNNAKQSDILKTIYQKTQFWQRNLEKNVVDMSQINFSVADQILNGLSSSKSKGLFKEEFNSFMTFMQDKIDKSLHVHKYSLNGIIKILQEDAVGQIEAHSFLNGMKEFNSQFYKFSQAFKEKRQKTQANLFNLNQLNESIEASKGLINNEAINKQRQEKEKEIRQIYFIKKFKVLEFVQSQALKLNNPDTVQRNVQWLEKMSAFFIELFRRFNFLRIVKSDSEKIIYKYSYIIQRLIEQSKIFTLILYSNEENKKKFDSYKQNMVEIFRPLQDRLFAAFGEINVPELKKQFVKTLDFNKLKVVNKEIINFFEEINSQNDSKMPLIISKLIITYANTVLQKRRLASEQEKNFISFKLLTYRKMFFQYLKNVQLEGTKKEKEQITQKLFILTNLLGQVLSALGLFECSRQVFKSINDAQQVFKIYQNQLKSVEENKPKLRTLLIDYGKYAGQCHRQQLAMKCLQQAYSLSKSYNEFKEVSTQIVNLKKVKVVGDRDPYLQRFHQSNYCQQLSKNIETTLQVYQSQSI